MADFKEFDFGFTAVTEDELEVVQKKNIEVDNSNEKAYTLYNMIKPLINNLQKNPEKDYIYWPNRLRILEEFSDELDKVLEK